MSIEAPQWAGYLRTKTLLVVAAFLFLPLVLATGATAQEKPLNRDGLHSSKLLILRHLAPTGAVVPKLGKPQIGPATGVNRRVQRQDNQTTNTICSNCGLH